MNRHGAIKFIVIYKVKTPNTGFDAYATRLWTLEHNRASPSDDVDIGSLNEMRTHIKNQYPRALCIGADPGGPEDIVEMWVIPWGEVQDKRKS